MSLTIVISFDCDVTRHRTMSLRGGPLEITGGGGIVSVDEFFF